MGTAKVWELIVRYWKASGFTVASILAGAVWLFHRYQTQRQRRFDNSVLEALGNPQWSKSQVWTGGGQICVRASDIAKHLGGSVGAVTDSLERLEEQGKVRRGEGTLDNPAPYWSIVLR